MHEVYMLAILFNKSRQRTVPRTRDERIREEQAFYDLHARDRTWKPGFKRFAPVPLVLVASAAVMGLTHLLLR